MVLMWIKMMVKVMALRSNKTLLGPQHNHNLRLEPLPKLLSEALHLFLHPLVLLLWPQCLVLSKTT